MYRCLRFHEPGARTTVIIGSYGDQLSPVKVLAETLYLEQQLAAGTQMTYEKQEELAVYVITGAVQVGECRIESGQMALFNTASRPTLTAAEASRIMIFGGGAMSPRHHFWNFVHSSRERIEQAKQDWKNGRFDTVKGDDEFIPLPRESK